MERLEITLSLIKLFQEKEELWNMHSKLYKRLDARQKAHQEIALEMQMSVDEVKKRIKSIRSVYVAEKGKVEASIRSGLELYEPKLAWYKKMAFLDKCIVPRKIKDECHSKDTPETKRNTTNNKISVSKQEQFSEQQVTTSEECVFSSDLLRGERYKTRCAEVFWTTLGRVIFHCTLCDFKFVGYDSYVVHLTEHEHKGELQENELFIQHSMSDNLVNHEVLETNFTDAHETYSISIIKAEEEEIVFDERNGGAGKTDQEILCDGDYVSTGTAEEEILCDEDNVSNGAAEEEILCDGDKDETVAAPITDFRISETDIECDEPENESTECRLSELKTKNVARKNGSRAKSFDSSAQETYDDLNCKDLLLEMNIETVREVKKLTFPRSMLTPEEERKHKCPVCGFGFKERHNMVHHLRRHSHKKDYKCSICSKAFYTPSEVRVHIRSHTKERPFLCSICGRAYKYSTQLVDHMKRHNPARKAHQCNECNKCFYDKKDLAEHMLGHSAVTKFACDLCPASFTRRAALTNHRKLHDNRKEYKCQLCSAAFNQRAGLFNHRKMVHQCLGYSV